MKKDQKAFFEALYKNFNDRNIDIVIEEMTPDVQWANGMDGGYVYGQDAVKNYWTQQFELISSIVTPVQIKKEKDAVVIKVHQVVHDIYGELLADGIVKHIFHLKDKKIYRFDIGKK